MARSQKPGFACVDKVGGGAAARQSCATLEQLRFSTQRTRRMLRFTLDPLLMALTTLFIVAVAVFVLIRSTPGDPAQPLLGDLADTARLLEVRAHLGLDQSWLAQFGVWGGHALRGDLGVSITTGEPVLQLVTSRFLVSAQIVVLAVLLAALVAV